MNLGTVDCFGGGDLLQQLLLKHHTLDEESSRLDPSALCLVFSAQSKFSLAPLDSEQWNEGGFLEQFLFLSPIRAPLSRLI